MNWQEVRPVLDATYRVLEERDGANEDAVNDALGRAHGDIRTERALALLAESGYIGGPSHDMSPVPVLIKATEKGLQEASGWPRDGGGDEQVALLLKLLDERIEDQRTPEEERGKLRRARDAFAGLSRDIAVGVLTAYTTRATGVSGES